MCIIWCSGPQPIDCFFQKEGNLVFDNVTSGNDALNFGVVSILAKVDSLAGYPLEKLPKSFFLSILFAVFKEFPFENANLFLLLCFCFEMLLNVGCAGIDRQWRVEMVIVSRTVLCGDH